MARIDIRDIDEDTLNKLDEQKKKYGLNSRSDYIKLLINLDILTNIVEKINMKESKQHE